MFCVVMRRDTFETVGPLDERFDHRHVRGRRLLAAGSGPPGCGPVFDDRAFVHHFGEATLGALAPGRPAPESCSTPTAPPGSRRSGAGRGSRTAAGSTTEYEAVIVGVRRAPRRRRAPGGRGCAVVSQGDPRLVTVPGRRASHFPGEHDGEYRRLVPRRRRRRHLRARGGPRRRRGVLRHPRAFVLGGWTTTRDSRPTSSPATGWPPTTRPASSSTWRSANERQRRRRAAGAPRNGAPGSARPDAGSHLRPRLPDRRPRRPSGRRHRPRLPRARAGPRAGV